MKNPIEMFLHCKKCVEEVMIDAALATSAGGPISPAFHQNRTLGTTSPADYARFSVGITGDNAFCVWCERHNEPVGTFNDPRVVDWVKEFRSQAGSCPACGQGHEKGTYAHH